MSHAPVVSIIEARHTERIAMLPWQLFAIALKNAPRKVINNVNFVLSACGVVITNERL